MSCENRLKWKPSRRWMRFAAMGFAVFVAGYYAFQNVWLHLLWLVFAVAVPVWARTPSPREWIDGRPLFFRAAVVFVLGMWLLSWRPGAPRPEGGGQWIVGGLMLLGDGALLIVFLRMALRLGEHGGRLDGRRVMALLVGVAVVTVVISYIVIYGVLGYTPMNSRLRNMVVHFGLAPVLSGLTYAFAGLAAAVLSLDEPRRKFWCMWLGAEALLLFGAFAAHSRGALLALAAGFLVVVVFNFRRALLAPLAVLALVVMTYQVALPRMEHRARVAVDPTVSEDAVINPAAGLVERKDAGRLKLYRLLLDRMQTPWDHALGRGHWADDQGTERMPWAQHPHSAYLATYYRGGVVGVFVLVFVLSVGFWRCCQAACRGPDGSRGQVMWLALASFGAVALLFDGDDLTRIASLPRVEPLLLWFPLAVGVGLAGRRRYLEARDDCGSIPS